MKSAAQNRMSTSLHRAAYFSCGYAYNMPEKSESENQKVYGPLWSSAGLGRNFRFEASFTGSIDPLSGMIVNLRDIDQWLKKVTEQLDHRFLNTDVEYFKVKVPTPENIARFIFFEIQKQLPSNGVKLSHVRLFENDNRWLDFTEQKSSGEK